MKYKREGWKKYNTSTRKIYPTSAMVKNESVQLNLAWSNLQVDVFLSSFYLGKSLLHLPSVFFCRRLGARVIMGYAILLTGLLNLLLPTAAISNFVFACIIRVTQGGIFAAFIVSAMTFFETWCPVNEKSMMMAIDLVGIPFGVILGKCGAAFIIGSESLGGWPSVFYSLGAFILILSTVWFFVVSDSPKQHRYISEEEKNYIEMSASGAAAASSDSFALDSSKIVYAQLAAILRSKVGWVIHALAFSVSWTYYALPMALPTYLDQVMKLTITKNGLVSSSPFIGYIIAMPLGGFISDAISRNNLVSKLNNRKLFVSVGLFLPAALLLGVPLVAAPGGVVAIMVAAMAVSPLANLALGVNFLDVAPHGGADVLFGLRSDL